MTDIHKKHILIIDDNLMNLQITAKILKDEGYLISLAQDGKNGLNQLNKLDQQAPDMILLDIMMPGMNGIDLCKKIKQNENHKEIPVIFLTAKNQTEDLVEGFKVGGVDYITKPFIRDELLMRVKNHLELAGSRKKIIEMNKTRDKLYSIIAHDIRSPFATISQLIDAISDGCIDVGSTDFMEIIHHLKQKTKETSTLLDNLLEWANLHSEKISLTSKSTNIYSILNECIQLFKGNARNKNITIEFNIPKNLEAFFDEISIHTVFRNIISNAIKFTPDNGKINICSDNSENFVIICIKDTGKGMPDIVLDSIFNKNEHYTTLGTKDERGSGLGLYLVKDFVSQNKGKIKVESKEGKGTNFMVFLPC